MRSVWHPGHVEGKYDPVLAMLAGAMLFAACHLSESSAVTRTLSDEDVQAIADAVVLRIRGKRPRIRRCGTESNPVVMCWRSCIYGSEYCTCVGRK